MKIGFAHLLLGLLLMPFSAVCDHIFPHPDWKDEPSPIANPNAKPGGEISVFAGQYPKSFNYYTDNNSVNSELFSAMYNTLITLNSITAEYEPGLAKKWSISDDKKTFTFWLDERARWSDGKPITAEDVRWTYDIVMDPETLSGVHKMALSKFEPPEIIDKMTIRFKAKEVHWKNLSRAGANYILPRHAFKDKDFNKITSDLPVVSGPYIFKEVKELIYVKLQRRDDWWGWQLESSRGMYNFNTITCRFYNSRENAFEAFKKGMIDIYPVYVSRLWVNETKGEKFNKNWIVKQRVHNYEPARFQGFAMNMRKEPFKDILVRKALAHLVNREKMNRKMMYSQYTMHKSYWEDLYSPDNPCRNEYIDFNKDKARAFLDKAGWKVNPETGLLEKNGRKLSFNFSTRDASAEKFVNMYAEDLKDVGIELKIVKKDWASWMKDMETFNFEMTWAAWGSVIFKDPEDMWHSREAKRDNGNNITGLENEKIDELIEKQKTIFSLEPRNKILREIDAILTDLCPYALLWTGSSIRLVFWNKFGTPPTVLSKFGDENSALWYWWFDEDSDADLTDAIRTGEELPARPADIYFDKEFKKKH